MSLRCSAWLDSQPLTTTTKAAGHIFPAVRDTHDPNPASETQQKHFSPASPSQRSSVWFESTSHEMSAQPRAANCLHFLRFILHWLCTHLRDFSAYLRKCLWGQPDITVQRRYQLSQNKQATKRLDFICAAKHKDHWHNKHAGETRHGFTSMHFLVELLEVKAFMNLWKHFWIV